MHSTKNDILGLLKRNDGATVDELASSLNLAAMTVRQHLTALERDDLVKAREVRRQTGRPHYLYTLTGDGHRRVLDGHDRMLALLVEQAGFLEAADLAGVAPVERRRTLFLRAATALAEAHRPEVLAASGAAQADHIVTILRAHGGFADWHLAGEGYEIRDFGCMYRSSVTAAGSCAWHETLLSRLTGVPVYPAEAAADCADCCRYIIAAAAATVSNTQRGNGHERH